jgi:hypothetical protein
VWRFCRDGYRESSEGEDFSGEAIVLTFEPFELRKTLDLRALILDDDIPESDETFILQLKLLETSGELGSSGAILGDKASATVTIISDDSANEVPIISEMPDLALLEHADPLVVSFTVEDGDTAPNLLRLKVLNSNEILLPGLETRMVAAEGQVSTWEIPLRLALNQFGVSQITVQVSDGSQTVESAFRVTVTARNDAPQISGIPILVRAVQERVVVPFKVTDDQTSVGDLFTFISTNQLEYLSQGHVMVAGSGAARELILNPKLSAEGWGVFSLVVVDAGGLSATHDFEVDFGGAPPEPELPELRLDTSDPANMILSWEGDFELLFTEDLLKGFEPVAAAKSPYPLSTGEQGFYRLEAR